MNHWTLPIGVILALVAIMWLTYKGSSEMDAAVYELFSGPVYNSGPFDYEFRDDENQIPEVLQ